MQEQEFHEILSHYQLSMLRDWKMATVIRAICNNQNDAGVVVDDILGFIPLEKEPAWISEPSEHRDKFISEMKSLFDRGWEILLETISNIDDEGGPLYCAYICSPEVYRKYNRWHDTLDMDTYSGLSTEILFIANNPKDFKLIWAGPH